MRKRVARFFGVIASLLIACIAAELAGRVILPRDRWTPPPPSTIDPYSKNPYVEKARPFLFFHIPNSRYTQARSSYRVEYSINSLGFRGPDPTPRPPAGKKRLMTIGDSIVEGHGSEWSKTFSSLLNLKDWEVLNCGVQGASPIYYALNLDRYLSLNPDAVLLVLFDNDLGDDRAREVEYDKLKILQTPDRLWRPGALPLLSRVRLLNVLRQIIPSKLGRIIRHNRATHSASSWDLSAAYLDYFAEEFARRNIRLVVAYLSLSNQRAPGGDPIRQHVVLLNQQISEWAQRRRVPFLSLMSAVSRLSDADFAQLILPDDGHPSEAGQRFLAQQLEPWLAQTINAPP